MSEVDKILDAVSLLQDFVLAQSGDSVAVERLMKRDTLPENIKVALAKAKKQDEPPAEKVCPDCGKPMSQCVCDKNEVRTKPTKEEIKMAEPVIVKRYGKPVRDEYKTDDEFAKALKEYEDFITDVAGVVRKSIEQPIGEAIKKSLVPEPPKNDPAKVDIMKVFKDSGNARNLDELLYTEGVEV